MQIYRTDFKKSEFLSWYFFGRTLYMCVYVCGPGTDELSRWWSAVLAVSAHWLTVTDDESSLVAAQRFYAVVDSMPKALHNSE